MKKSVRHIKGGTLGFYELCLNDPGSRQIDDRDAEACAFFRIEFESEPHKWVSAKLHL